VFLASAEFLCRTFGAEFFQVSRYLLASFFRIASTHATVAGITGLPDLSRPGRFENVAFYLKFCPLSFPAFCLGERDDAVLRGAGEAEPLPAGRLLHCTFCCAAAYELCTELPW
jgi:hypothetical protein